ncbi:TetR family transcriptional regulator [Marinobacterium sp. AK62]|uniref:TetR family transcriptional regulator n=1 Tax=Marinobacterium alkalitolerans TaxID=1542925 RepID=A0ABS3Z715_9GAMM|nr:TetR family transcriptional regulator [Marinobacterium alkalitolerans]MBP0047130.1 TetR family transcriptional regulator [Marinobacterium alkalitolerans]
MARRTREEAEQTRQTLLTTALTLFSEQGIGTTTLKQIAREAGVTHGAVYWHFRNRPDLLEQIHHAYMLPFEAQYLEQRQGVQQDALAALDHYFLGVLRAFSQDEQAQQLYRVFYMPASPVADLAGLEQRLADNRQLWQEQLRYFLKQARKQKQLRKKASPAALAQTLQLMLDGLLCQWLRSGQAFDLVEQGRSLLALLRDGLPEK